MLEELAICDMDHVHPLDLHTHNVSQPSFPALRRLHKWTLPWSPSELFMHLISHTSAYQSSCPSTTRLDLSQKAVVRLYFSDSLFLL